MKPEKCGRCNQPIQQTDREFAMNPENHPGVLEPIHRHCYNAMNDVDPDLPWTDPLSGEVDFETMEQDLGVATGDDEFDEDEFY